MQYGERRRLSATERESIVRLKICHQEIEKNGDALDRRAATIRGGKRDMALVKAVLKKLVQEFEDTIPDDQLMTYARNLSMVSFIVGVRRPGGTARNMDEYGMWLPHTTIKALMDGCHDQCVTCMRDKGQQKQCPLRKALDSIPNDVPQKGDYCPYYTIL